MNDELDTYLEFLFGGLEGYVYSPVKGPAAFIQKFFEWPAQKQDLQDWIKTSDLDVGSHVYISPGIYKRQEATKSSVKELQVVWVEFDGQEQIDFAKGDLPRPSAIVQTSSSTHLHAYWRIPTSHKEVVEDVNKRLTYFLGADLSGHDSTQLLRPPGTVNRKHDLPVLLAHVSDVTHALSDFDNAPSVSSPVGVVEVGQLLKATEVFAKHEFPTSLIKLIKLETPSVGARSSFMTKLAHELAEEGLDALGIVSLLFHADERIGKFKTRSDRLQRLTQLAELALHKVLIAESVSVYTFEDILNAKQELKWILPGNWLHSTGQMILSSAPGVGKTQLCLQLAYTLAMDENFLGQKCIDSQEHSIFFMSLEMDIISLGYILKKQMENWSSSPRNVHVIDEPRTLTQYENEISRLEATVVVVDSLTELLDGLSDNPNDSARIVMKWCRKVRRRYNCAIILIHHNRKATEGNKKPKSLSDLAGSFQFGKDSDTVAQLWSDHKGLEFSTVKCRFGPNTEFFVQRSDSLWFTRSDNDKLKEIGQQFKAQLEEPDNSTTEVQQEIKEELNADRGPEPTGFGENVDIGF